MVAALRIALLVLLSVPIVAAVPIGEPRFIAAGGQTQAPIAVANGDLGLVMWDRGEGAVRFDAAARPLDVPAIALPKPQFTAGADLVSSGSGWTVGWTIFELDDLARSALRLADVGRDGAVGNVREYPLPVVVPQGAPTALAMRGGVTVVAYVAEFRVVVAAVGERGEVTSNTIDGVLVDLVATPAGFALLLREGVVLLNEAGVPAPSRIALPAGFTADAIATDGNELLVGGTMTDAVVIVRVRDGMVAIATTIRDRGAAFVRIAHDGRELLAVWRRGSTAAPNGSRVWDLMAARVPLGAAAGTAVRVRAEFDTTGRFQCCPDAPAVVALRDGWTMLWSEGFRGAGLGWLNLFAAPVTGAPSPVAEPRLMSFAAAPQLLIGTAARDGVLIVVWQEADVPSGARTHAARYTITGKRVDAHDLDVGAIRPYAVRATPWGFAILTLAEVITLDANGARATHPAPAPTMDLSCTSELCLAAWTATSLDTHAIRVSRWRNGALDDPHGIAIHHSGAPYTDFEVANDGERFLVAFARPASPGGSILSVARVERTADSWSMTTSDIAASTVTISGLHLLFEADRYLVTWLAQGQRASRVTLEGHSIDGDETGWEGWPLVTDDAIDDLQFDGERTLLVAAGPERYVLYELRERVAVPLSSGRAAHQAAIECAAPRVCAAVVRMSVRGEPWFRSERLFLIGPPSKRRAARP